MSELITYRVKKHGFNSAFDLKLPSTAKMIYKDGEIGYALFNGCNHYMAVFRKSDCDEGAMDEVEEGVACEVFKFDDLYIVIYNNIAPIDPLPVCSPEELMTEFKLNEYSISYQSMKQITNSDKFHDILNDPDSKVEDFIDYIRSCGFYRSARIKSIEGPYNVELVVVYCEYPSYSIELRHDEYLDKLLNPKLTFELSDVVLCENSLTTFNKLYEHTLSNL